MLVQPLPLSLSICAGPLLLWVARPRAGRGLQQVLWKLQAWWLFACSHHQRYPGKSCCGPSTVPVAVGSASRQHKQSKVLRYIPARSCKLLPPTAQTPPSCSAPLADLQAVNAKYMESQGGCKEALVLVWRGMAWEERKVKGMGRRGGCAGL